MLLQPSGFISLKNILSSSVKGSFICQHFGILFNQIDETPKVCIAYFNRMRGWSYF